MRDVILMVGVEELSYEEAAALLSVPAEPFAAALSRARCALREALRERGYDSVRSPQPGLRPGRRLSCLAIPTCNASGTSRTRLPARHHAPCVCLPRRCNAQGCHARPSPCS